MKLSRYRNLLVLLLDLGILIAVSMIYFVMTPETNGTGSRELIYLVRGLAELVLCVLAMQLLFRTYDTLWRYAGAREYLTLLIGMVSGAAVDMGMMHVWGQHLSRSFVGSVTAYAMLLMMLVRFAYRQFREKMYQTGAKDKKYTAIIGAGAAGEGLLHEMQTNPNSKYIPYCLIDDNPDKIGRRIHGVRTLGPIDKLPELLRETPVTELLVAVPSANSVRRREILALCTSTKCHVQIVPDILGQTGGVPAMRSIQLEDLLGRKSVQLNTERAREFLQNKTVLVTGGGGSIGSELCRQIAACHPKRLVLFDIYENNAYDIQQELIRQYGDRLQLDVWIGSVRDAGRVDRLFSAFQPQVVFHAAAHKHVPLMEDSPAEAIKNNVFGTWNVVQAAERYEVEKFVLISTDKAVNPTNIMGATKRMCELILQSRNGQSKTVFSAVRFGNVLGSNGSVIPLFRRQIENGGPVTITDRRIVRYFMTIPEAAQLVLEAGAMAGGGEVYVLDMGEPVKILDLAENLIRLHGLQPYRDIEIREIGLRPGEKLYEELLIKSKELGQTANKKIFIERREEVSPEQMDRMLASLRSAAQSDDPARIRDTLHQCVKSYHRAEDVNRAAIAQMQEREQQNAAEYVTAANPV